MTSVVAGIFRVIAPKSWKSAIINGPRDPVAYVDNAVNERYDELCSEEIVNCFMSNHGGNPTLLARAFQLSNSLRQRVKERRRVKEITRTDCEQHSPLMPHS